VRLVGKAARRGRVGEAAAAADKRAQRPLKLEPLQQFRWRHAEVPADDFAQARRRETGDIGERAGGRQIAGVRERRGQARIDPISGRPVEMGGGPALRMSPLAIAPRPAVSAGGSSLGADPADIRAPARKSGSR
jgi:hypothetical protein